MARKHFQPRVSGPKSMVKVINTITGEVHYEKPRAAVYKEKQLARWKPYNGAGPDMDSTPTNYRKEIRARKRDK